MVRQKNAQTVATVLSIFLIAISLFVLLITENNYQIPEKDVKGETTFEIQPTIDLTPELNISRFDDYVISSNDIPGTPQSVSLELWGKNGDGGTCWDYTVEGTCTSHNFVIDMNDNNGTWEFTDLRPDYIYPEIYFASSHVTWQNPPVSTILNRNNYSIMHLNNPFTMVGDMYLYIEFNAYPISTTNSEDLQVYLVEKGKDITKFNTDWRNDTDVELVGTFSKTSSYHHIHGANSSHRLIPLATNSDGTVGSKNLDISNDFWIVLYTNSPNNNKGWSLQYQPSELCSYDNRWYSGVKSDWTTTELTGCPDSHIHIARRNQSYMDGIEMTITADYGVDQSVSDPVAFYFGELPNLPPVASSFLTPTTGGTYGGNLEITWDPSSDPNDDPLTYNVYLKQNDSTVATLVNQGTSTSYTLDTTSYTDGAYSLSGEVCDSINPCVAFNMNGDFTISNTLPIQSLSSVTLDSNNSNAGYVKAGNTITLEFESTGTISTPTVDMYFNGDEGINSGTLSSNGNVWTYTHVVEQNDTNGKIAFVIDSETLDQQYDVTTNSSAITVDTVAPTVAGVSPAPGTYASTSPTNVTLSSGENIFYTINGTNPSCSVGTNYSTPISILSDITIKSIVCDNAGNSSEILASEYLIREDLTSISVSSNNSKEDLAKGGDILILEFTASGSISNVFVSMAVDDTKIVDSVAATNVSGDSWKYEYTVQENDPNGVITFEIVSNDLYKVFDSTTDSSAVTIDTIAPSIPMVNPSSGTYGVEQLLSLSATGQTVIKYTLDETVPTCLTGLLYIEPLGISESTTVKSIACDEAGNVSEVVTSVYFINIANLDIPPEEEEEIVVEVKKKEESVVSKNEDIVEAEKSEEEGIEEITESSVKEEPKNTKIEKYQAEVIRRGQSVYISELRIKVLDHNGDPLEGVLVNVHSEPKVAITDVNGVAIVNNVAVGEHTICFGYENNVYEEKVVINEPNIEIENVDLEIITMSTEKSLTDTLWYWIGGMVIVLIMHLLFSLQRKWQKRMKCKV